VLIVANANNRGMAVMAGVNTDIKTIKDLKGKKVAIWPGSTQEAVILELAVPNVELAWKLDDVFMERANAYTRLMFENKQIRQVPDLNRHITKQFM